MYTHVEGTHGIYVCMYVRLSVCMFIRVCIYVYINIYILARYQLCDDLITLDDCLTYTITETSLTAKSTQAQTGALTTNRKSQKAHKLGLAPRPPIANHKKYTSADWRPDRQPPAPRPPTTIPPLPTEFVSSDWLVGAGHQTSDIKQFRT